MVDSTLPENCGQCKVGVLLGCDGCNGVADDALLVDDALLEREGCKDLRGRLLRWFWYNTGVEDALLEDDWRKWFFTGGIYRSTGRYGGESKGLYSIGDPPGTDGPSHGVDSCQTVQAMAPTLFDGGHGGDWG